MTALLALISCGEYNAVQKYGDSEYKYEYAKACYARGKYTRAFETLSGVITAMKGSGYGEESLYLMGLSAYHSGDLTAAAEAFRKYYQSYPRGMYVEDAHYYCGRALYDAVPSPKLDQTTTKQAIAELQRFLDVYPTTRLKDQTQEMVQQLQDHLVEKEYLSAKLYYNLGGYFGNINANNESNYTSCIITAENAIKTFPYTNLKEDLSILILRAKYKLAQNSVLEKEKERFQNAIDEYYGFKNEFPESKYLNEAEKIFKNSSEKIGTTPAKES